MIKVLSVKEVAELLQTSKTQVRKMIPNGELPAVKVGREYRIPMECLVGFIEGNL